jgi:Flp pilus assembly protein TadG
MHTTTNARRDQKGSAIIEFSVIATIMLLLLFGVADFSRLFYESIEVVNAAAAGAHYGAFSSATQTSNYTDSTGIIDAATAEAPELTGLIVNPTTVCQDDTGGTALCNASGAYKYVSVNAVYTFQTLLRYPLIPSSVTISKTVMMRYQ